MADDSETGPWQDYPAAETGPWQDYEPTAVATLPPGWKPRETAQSMLMGEGGVKRPSGMEAGTEMTAAVGEAMKRDPIGTLFTPAIPIPRIQGRTTLGKLAAAPINVASGLAQGVESLGGLLTLPFGGPLVKGVFGGLAAKAAGEQLGQASVTGDAQQAAEGVLGAAVAPAIALHRTLPVTRPAGLPPLPPEPVMGEALKMTRGSPPVRRPAFQLPDEAPPIVYMQEAARKAEEPAKPPAAPPPAEAPKTEVEPAQAPEETEAEKQAMLEAELAKPTPIQPQPAQQYETTQAKPNIVRPVPSGALTIAVRFPNGEVRKGRTSERTHAQIFARLWKERHPNLISENDPEVEPGWVDSSGNFYTNDEVQAVQGYAPDSFRSGGLIIPKQPPPVPPEVLADYPDLAKPPPVPTPAAPPAAPVGEGKAKSELPPSARLSEAEIARRNEEQRWLEQQPEYQKANAALKAVKAKIGNRLLGGINTAAQQKMADRLSKAEDAVAEVVDRLTKERAQPTPPAPATEGKVEPANVPAVAAQVEAKTKQVIADVAPRTAKEVKSALIDTIQKQIAEAPSESKWPGVVKERQRMAEDRFAQLNKEFWDKAKAEIGTVTIEIPGDGVFTVLNTKEALGEVLARAKRIPLQPPATFKKAGISKEDKLWIEQQLAKGGEPTPGEPPETGPGTGAGPGTPSGKQGSDISGPGWAESASEDIMGVRQVTREKQAAVGQPVIATPGEGTNLEKSLADGRARLGRDPASAEKVRENFDRTGQLSPEDFNVARAKYEQVMAQGRKVAQHYGTMSEEYFHARMEAFTWSDLTKRMQTAWHKMGMGQQGETDIDTGEILDLENEYHDKTGKDFTPDQRKKGERIAKVNKAAQTATAEAKDTLNKHLVAKTTSMSAAETQAQKAVWRWHRMNAATIAREERAARGDIWIKAREYLEKGMDNFDDIRKKLATDLGMPIEQVTRLLAQDRRAKYLADDLWRKQQTERRLKSQAKRWVESQATPLYLRALQSIPRAMFGLKVGFHGTVALGTHAPTVAFQPRFWTNYVRDFGKMYHMVGSKTYYENQVQDLLRRDNYVVANRAGLINDPFVYEDYTSPDTAKYFGGLTGMGNRGYTVLKILRQDMFDQYWSLLPRTAQIPEMAQALAQSINHATGVVQGRAPRGTNLALFAPRLEASRVMWLAGDPIKAVNTLLRWNDASLGEKYFAMNQLKEKAWVLGTMTSLLALNAGVLAATGSKQKINVTDPFSSDFLKFKVAGMNVSYGNPMITMARLPLRLFVAVKNEGKLNKIVYEDENVATVLFEYVRSQMSPFAGTATDLMIGRDYMRKPLPRAAFGILPGKKNLPLRLRKQGVKPYSWPEYASEQLAMIPLQEALKEVWGKNLVMDAASRERSIKALATIIVMGGTGARVSEDYSLTAGKSNTPAAGPWTDYQQAVPEGFIPN